MMEVEEASDARGALLERQETRVSDPVSVEEREFRERYRGLELELGIFLPESVILVGGDARRARSADISTTLHCGARCLYC